MSGLVFDLEIGSIDVSSTTARIPDQDAFIDKNQDAQIILGDFPLEALDLFITDPKFLMGIRTEIGEVTLGGEFEVGTKVYVDGEEIAIISALTSDNLSFTFTTEATAERVEKLIRALTFKDTEGSNTFQVLEGIEIYLSDTSGNMAYVWMEVGDTVRGTEDADVFIANSSVIGGGDDLDGGAGDDILQLNGGGEFYLSLMGKLASIETIQGSDASDYISMHSSQWLGLKRLDGRGGTNQLDLYGRDSDLADTEILGFEKISIMNDDAKVSVANVAIARLIDGYHAQGDELVIESGVLSGAERLELHRRGIDKITTLRDGHTTLIKAPELTSFGEAVKAVAGETVFLDRGRDAVLEADMGLDFLAVAIDGVVDGETLGIVVPAGLTLTNGLMLGSELTMDFTTPDGTAHHVEFGYVSSSSGTGENVRNVGFKFNENAKIEWVQQLIRSLTYKNSADIVGERKIILTMEDIGGRRSTAAVTFSSTITDPPPVENKAPANLALSGASTFENAAAGTVIGILTATDGDGDTLSYALSDDAGGRFHIFGDRLVVKDGAKLDFETTASYKITVKVSDGVTTVRKDFIIRIDDVMETVTGATRAKDVLGGGIGVDRLAGGYGNDVLTGGAGADHFVFDSALGKGTTRANQNKKVNFDTITDFTRGEDKILLDNAIFKKLGKAGTESAPAALNKSFFKKSKAADKNDYLIYKNGVLSYDADGNGTRYKAVEIIKIANKAALSAADFLII